MNRTLPPWLSATLRALGLLLMVVWILTPFYFLLLVSLQPRAESLRIPPDWTPSIDFSNFQAVLSRAFSGRPPSAPSDLIFPGIVNSAIVGTSVAVLNLVLGSSAGYAFARFRFPGHRTIPFALLGSQMIPGFALIVPYYVVLRNLGLTNTRIGVIVALAGFTLPFTIWLLRAYFEGVPLEVERAARIDGCSRLTTFWRVTLPLARPGMISVALFAFMISWNDFVFSVVLNSRRDAILVQPAIAGLYNVREQSFGIMAAGSLLAAAPTVLIGFALQRLLVRGLLSGVGKA